MQALTLSYARAGLLGALLVSVMAAPTFARGTTLRKPNIMRFIGFGNSSLDLEVFSYVTVTDARAYLEVAEDLNLRIMDIVAAAGSGFAFPSQTTYIEQDSGLDPDRSRAAEAQVQEWRERGELYLPRFPPRRSQRSITRYHTNITARLPSLLGILFLRQPTLQRMPPFLQWTRSSLWILVSTKAM
jgi:hypothetical protein